MAVERIIVLGFIVKVCGYSKIAALRQINFKHATS